MRFIGNVLKMPLCAIWWTLVLFVSGLIYPWEDVDFYATAIPGRILGSIVCSIVFAIVGFFFGWYIPWDSKIEEPTPNFQ